MSGAAEKTHLARKGPTSRPLAAYITAVRGGSTGGPDDDPFELHTDATSVGPWEKFSLVWLVGGKCALRTKDGHWLTVVGGGGVGAGDVADRLPIHTDATRRGPMETFTVTPLP